MSEVWSLQVFCSILEGQRLRPKTRQRHLMALCVEGTLKVVVVWQRGASFKVWSFCTRSVLTFLYESVGASRAFRWSCFHLVLFALALTFLKSASGTWGSVPFFVLPPLFLLTLEQITNWSGILYRNSHASQQTHTHMLHKGWPTTLTLGLLEKEPWREDVSYLKPKNILFPWMNTRRLRY